MDSVLSLFSSLLRGLAGLVLPAACAACGRLTVADAALCDDCLPTLERIEAPCPRCALPLVDGACRSCARAPPPWTRACAPFVFDGALATAIRRFKLGRRPELGRPLVRLLAPSLASRDVEAFVPVPLHPRRLRWREFDQSVLLVRLGRVRGSPPLVHGLARVRDTAPQSRLDAAARRANVAGAFRVDDRARVAGRHVCLVDDVLTTGATAAACAVTLLEAGARRVDVLTLARALP